MNLKIMKYTFYQSLKIYISVDSTDLLRNKLVIFQFQIFGTQFCFKYQINNDVSLVVTQFI